MRLSTLGRQRAAGLALAAAALLGLPREAASQVELYHGFYTYYTVGLFGGYYVASDIFDNTESKGSLSLKNAGEFGLRATAFLQEWMAAELAYTRNGSDLEAHGTFTPPLPADFKPGHIDFDQYDLDLLFLRSYRNERLQPYFTLGAGLSVTHPDLGPSVGSKTYFALNFGVGTFIATGMKNLGVRVDARFRSTNTSIITSSSNYTDPWGYTWDTSSDWYSSGEFTAGVDYRFGGK